MKTKLLIVEDDEALCYMEKCGLEDKGYDVVTASNGKERLRSFVENKPDDVSNRYKFGVNNYVKKPFTPKELLSAMQD